MTDTPRSWAEYLSPKLMKRYGYYRVPVYCHWCPACEQLHGYACDEPFANGARWAYNGNPQVPDFKPSMNISWEPPRGIQRCHYVINNGRIEYCGDCTHELSGKSMELPDIPEQQWLLAGIPSVDRKSL